MSTPVPNLGQCGRVVDEEQELICPGEAVTEVLVRTKFTLAVVRLCVKCTADHRKFYNEINARRPRRRRNERNHPTPTERPSNSTPGSNSDQSRPTLQYSGVR